MDPSPRATPQDLSLGRVQLEAVGVRPCIDVLDAGYEPIVELGGFLWRTEAIDLRVIGVQVSI